MAAIMLPARSTSRGSDFEKAYASPKVTRKKGTDRASLHRHDSKDLLPRGLNDEAGKLSDDGRKRRSQGSSDDEGKIADDGFSNEDLRVGGPYLCSLPLISKLPPDTHPLRDILLRKISPRGDLHRHISDIIRGRNIELDSADRVETLRFRLRQSKNDPEAQPVPTIVILATRHIVDDVWLKAARQIYSLLCHNGLKQVSVEILDPEAELPPKTFPVLREEPVYKKWDSVLRAILKDIEKKDLVLIGCYRRGRNSKPQENPPTVLVIVDIHSKKNWKPTRDLIVEILRRFHLPMVAVEICKDELVTAFGAQEGFDNEILKRKAMPGGPIANVNNKLGSGSLGGFIELQDAKLGKWSSPYALTCYHVVHGGMEDPESRDLAAVKEWSDNGVPMHNRDSDLTLLKRYLMMDHPSTLAKTEKIAGLQEDIDRIEARSDYKHALEMSNAGLLKEIRKTRQDAFKENQKRIKDKKAEIKDIEKFDNHLGFVIGASGYRKKQLHVLAEEIHPTVLDWALIMMLRGWKHSNNLVDSASLLQIATTEDLAELEGSKIFFQGYRSERQAVRYNGLKSASFVEVIVDGKKQNPPTLEYTITGLNQGDCIVQPGDSGSLLFTQYGKGEVIGMVIAGMRTNDIGRFTRIDDLVDDIKEHAGAKDVRMHGGKGQLA